MNQKLLAILILIFSYGEIGAQDLVIDKKITYWTRAYLEYQLNDPVTLDLELENRRYFVPHDQMQTILRFTLHARIYPWLTVGSGMGYSLEYSELTKLSIPEIRPHQEVNASHSKDNWDFAYRLKLEQRFIQDTTRIFNNNQVLENREDSFSFGFRSRYNVGAEYALIQRDKEKGHFTIQGNSEIMFTDTFRQFFDTFRQYVGFRYFLSKSSILELGYMLSLEKNYRYNILFDFDNIRFTFRQNL